MKYFSTFSGIGGFELGIQYAYESLQMESDGEANLRPEERQKEINGSGTHLPLPERHNGRALNRTRPKAVGFSEVDKYATAIYQKHFPEHKNYGDITKINAEELPDFDLLFGGFPCQAFSIAGKRRGFEDTRGTMFFELARILRAKQPRLFVFENVKGLLSHDNGQTFRTIIATLDELGYDLQWQVLNSKNHGVPQNRERVFIVGHLRGTPRPEVFPFGESNETPIRQDQDIAGAITANYWKGPETYGGRTFINQLNQPKHSNDRVYGADGISPTLNTMQGGNRQPKILGNIYPSGGENGDVLDPRGISKTLKSGVTDNPKHGGIGSSNSPKILEDMRIRRLTPTECERLQGFPDGWTAVANTSDTQRYKCLGNAVTVNVIRDIFERIL